MKANTLTINLALLCSILSYSAVSSATTSCDKTPWKYLSGDASYNKYTGLPNTTEDLSSKLPADLKTKLLTMLPEQIDVRTKAVTKAMLTNDKGANIFLKADANIKVSYLYSSTVLWNSLAYFTFKQHDLESLQESNIQDTIFFPNFNAADQGGPLKYGQSVNLGKFNAGDAIGFGIVHNFWDATTKNGPRRVSSIHGTQLTSCKQVFRTIRRLNPEPQDNNNLNQHTLLFSDIKNGVLILGMENLHRSNDKLNDYGPWQPGFAHDFNDVVIAIHVDPISAVVTDNIPDITTGTIPSPTEEPPKVTVSGQSGPTNWREITSPDQVTDTIKAAKKAAKEGKSL